jgi:class 3 adenylate cyclase
MAEPRIQYTKTSDGVNIAYWTMGEGPPLVYLAGVLSSHTRMELQRPSARSFYERLSQHRQLVRYDWRASGLSDRNVSNHSLEALLLDLDAVVDRLGLDSFSLFAQARAALVAVTYAARHPERVTRLILWNPSPGGRVRGLTSRDRALSNLAAQDWDLYAQLTSLLRFGWTRADEAQWTSEMMRSGSSQEAYLAFNAAMADDDVTPLLPLVKAPALVIHRRKVYSSSLDVARTYAADIPDAQVIEVEGRSWSPWGEDEDAIVEALDEFLGEGPEPTEALAGGLRTVLFTDIVGHTEMMQRLGDTEGRDVLREHERITRDLLKQHGGAEVKTMGDGFMASFGSVTSAMECAIALQQAFAAHTESMPEPLHVRVGLNAGEPIEEDGDLFGATVILASRIAAKAGAGEILIPEPVRHLLSGKTFVFSDRGEHEMKGFDDAVRLYEVRWRE